MREPALVPSLTIHFQTLNINILLRQTLCCYVQSVVTNTNTDIVEPGRQNQINWLGNDRIESYHLPEHPTINGPGITVSRQAIRRREIIYVDIDPRLCDRFILLAWQVIVDERRKETRLVSLQLLVHLNIETEGILPGLYSDVPEATPTPRSAVRRFGTNIRSRRFSVSSGPPM